MPHGGRRSARNWHLGQAHRRTSVAGRIRSLRAALQGGFRLGCGGGTTMDENSPKQPAEPRRVTLQLSAQGVINPALIAMRDSLEMISISLHALISADVKNIPVIPYCFNNFKFGV